MPRILTLLLVLLPATAGAMTSQPLLYYDFQQPDSGNPVFANAPEQIAAGLSAGAWQVRDGTLGFASGPGGISSDLAMLGRSWGSGSTPGNLFRLELTIDPGRSLRLDGYSFMEQASANGPTGWSLEIDGSEVASGITATGFTIRSGPLSLAPLQGTVLLELLGDGASSDSGSWRIDEFSLTGSLSGVPLPDSLLLLACTLPLLARRPRRG